MDQLQEIKIGVEYRKRDNFTGELVSLEYFPSSAEDFEGIDVQYITLPGWKKSTSGCKKFENLPTQAQDYVKKVETLLGVHIRWIGVGPGRNDIIERQISKNWIDSIVIVKSMYYDIFTRSEMNWVVMVKCKYSYYIHEETKK